MKQTRLALVVGLLLMGVATVHAEYTVLCDGAACDGWWYNAVQWFYGVFVWW